ncbi:hypothetical protein XENTR_v10005218 [Xenopus tropicalis]|nr:hypothetical protein XENTR_v10005218 [Xenopus tropicalis]
MDIRNLSRKDAEFDSLGAMTCQCKLHRIGSSLWPTYSPGSLGVQRKSTLFQCERDESGASGFDSSRIFVFGKINEFAI